ncbi:GCN5-related N-acetyltransferase [uncultured delta proteobacterium]|uniref:GCN5-related N-acetyltransferase n=1 Tax=uncultured delta proteobacterium TaxID=34034 RepID=A0A212KDH8_9DELT|nr:GCN5-related N-acetyltransferase [uncultured delta proteobacterium]
MKDRAIRFVRPGDARDAAGILAIYAPFVRDTPVTFEYTVPSIEEFTKRIEGIASVYPYLVCERDGEILAYAYASRHMERAAYAWDVQTSVYAAPDARGTGVARALYASLFRLLEELGYCNAYAVIAVPNPRSERFHASFGFVPAGVHHKSGYKGGAWHDVAWMEKTLAPHADTPVPPRPVTALDAAARERLLSPGIR